MHTEKTPAEKDYEGMREFQAKYIRADHEARDYKSILEWITELDSESTLQILEEIKEQAQNILDKWRVK